MNELQLLASQIASQLGGSEERALAILNSLVEKSIKMMKSGSTDVYVKDMLDGDGLGGLIGGQEVSADKSVGGRFGSEQTLRNEAMTTIIKIAKEKAGIKTNDTNPEIEYTGEETMENFDKYVAIAEEKLSYEAKKKAKNKTEVKVDGKTEDKYPMPDKAHARNAKARASAQYNKGNLTKAEFDRINKKADAMLK